MAHIHNCLHNQKILFAVQTNTAVYYYYGHSFEEKSKYELEEKNVLFITEKGVSGLEMQLSVID